MEKYGGLAGCRLKLDLDVLNCQLSSSCFVRTPADFRRPLEFLMSLVCGFIFQVKGSRCSKFPRKCSSSLPLPLCEFPSLPSQCYANANMLVAPTRSNIQFAITAVGHCVRAEAPSDLSFCVFLFMCWPPLLPVSAQRPVGASQPPPRFGLQGVRDHRRKGNVFLRRPVRSIQVPAVPRESVSSLSSDCYVTADCLLSWQRVSPRSRPTISQHTAAENASLSVTSQSNTSDWGENGMPFIALRAVKTFILKSSNKRNFPLAEYFFSCQLPVIQTDRGRRLR